MKNKKSVSTNNKALPLQRLLAGDFLRVVPLHQDIDALSVVPHRHDHYEMLYITGGQGSHLINFKAYDVKPGRVFFLHPGQVHLINKFERSGWLVMFGPELFSRFLAMHKLADEAGIIDAYTQHPYVDMDTELAGDFQAIISLLLNELAASNANADILVHYTALLLLQLNRAHVLQHTKDNLSPNNRTDLYRLKQLIDVHLKTQHQAAFYAAALQMDIKKINHICRQHTGLSVAGLLKERLLTESKISLQTSPLSIKQISYDLGFNDPAFFGRFFKRETGYTPAQYRELRVI